MLLNLHKKKWSYGLHVKNAEEHAKKNQKTMLKLLDYSKQYNKRLEEEDTKTAEELTVLNVGKLDPKKHLEADVEELMSANISQLLGTMLDTVVF